MDLLLIRNTNLVLRAGYGAGFNERGESCLWMLNSKSRFEVATARDSKSLKAVPEVAPDDEEPIELLRIAIKGKRSVLEDLDNLFWN